LQNINSFEIFSSVVDACETDFEISGNLAVLLPGYAEIKLIEGVLEMFVAVISGRM